MTEVVQEQGLGVVLRFRDLVTEMGGTIAEHRRVLRQQGHVWWGWWRRQSEHIPRGALADLFRDGAVVPVMLFDSGILGVHRTAATRVVVAPSVVGIQSPEFDSTPDYYVRGHYPVWFRLEGDIVPIDAESLSVVGHPTADPAKHSLATAVEDAHEVSLEDLRDERPTLWLARVPLDTPRG